MKRLLISSFFIALITASSAQSKVTGVQWTKAGEVLTVDVKGENLSEPKSMRVNQGRSFLLHFNASFEGKSRKEPIDFAGVEYLRAGWYSSHPARVRVHLQLAKSDTPIRVSHSGSSWQIVVNDVPAPTAHIFVANPLLIADNRLPGVIDDTPIAPQVRRLPSGSAIRLAFTSTDVASVLKAISIQSGANIVLASQSEAKITVNLTAKNTDEAIRAATSASGLSYSLAGGTYVVATSAELRQALVPFGTTTSFMAPRGLAAALSSRLQETFPLATMRTNGDTVLMTAQPEELREASALIRPYSREIEGNRAVSQIVFLAKASPADLEKMLSAIYPNLKVTSTGADGKEGGAISLTGRSPDVVEAKALAMQLDRESLEGRSLTFQVYELKYTSAPSIAEFLKKAAPDVEAIAGPESFSPQRGLFAPLGAALRSATGANSVNSGTSNNQIQTGAQTISGGTTKEKDGERATVVVLKGPKASVDAAAKLVASLDVRPIQVSVDVKVIETSPSFSENLGINFSWTALQFFEVAPGTPVPIPGTSRPAGAGQFSRAPWSFQGLMNALITKGEAKILANPSVRVINNNDANVFIGDTVRARVSQANGLGGQTVDVVEFPVGIILLIRPRVNADGNITMHVNPVVSTITAVGNDNIPQTSSREAETTVMVKDGETIVIGGLIRDEYSKIVQEIPILSKLPIIGELFKNRNTSRKHSEVVVTITPHIVKDTEGNKP